MTGQFIVHGRSNDKLDHISTLQRRLFTITPPLPPRQATGSLQAITPPIQDIRAIPKLVTKVWINRRWSTIGNDVDGRPKNGNQQNDRS